MESALILIVILLLAVPVMAIVALVQISGLKKRIAALEMTARPHAAPAAAAQPPEPEQPEAEASKTEAPETEASRPPISQTDETDETDVTGAADAPTPPPERPSWSGAALARDDGATPDNAAPRRTTRDSAELEGLIGAKWTVWIGGVAIALAGVFLVRYSIEAGLLGPGARIVLGGLLALALLAGGEALRRFEIKTDFTGPASAHIPGVLTGAGIVAGFATVYAAYALYGFLGPLAAFILLAVFSVLALASAMLHGPALAALGLIASLITPVLVSTDAPSAWSLFTYIAFITGVALFLAHLRHWLWLSVAAMAGAIGWALIWMATQWSLSDVGPMAAFMAALSALTVLFATKEQAGEAFLKNIPHPALPLLAAISFLVMPVVRLNNYDAFSLTVLLATLAGLIGGAWRIRGASLLVPWAGLMFVLIYVTWHVPALETLPESFTQAVRDQLLPPALRRMLFWGVGLSALFLGAGLGALRLGTARPRWAATAVAAPLLALVYAYYQATGFDHSFPFALISLLLAAYYGGLTELAHTALKTVVKRTARSRAQYNADIYAAGAVSALALSATIALDKGWLTIALALIAAGLAWVSGPRPVKAFRLIAIALAVIVAARLAYDPLIIGGDLGATPVFNWLLYGYGIPAAAFAYAAWMFRRQHDGLAPMVLEAAAIAFIVALLALQLHHLMNNGDVTATRIGLAEFALHSMIWLGLSIGLARLKARHGDISIIWRYARMGLSALALIAMAVGLLIGKNPYFTNDLVAGGIMFNTLILAYLAPAVLCAVRAITPQDKTDRLLTTGFATLALALAFAYITLQIRLIYHGPRLAEGINTDSELYTYSVAWLLFGVALLAGGIKANIQALRQAAFAIITLTVAKAFLYDMANLTGLLRVLSFLGLGFALIGIGLVYQRLMLRGRTGKDDGDGNSDGNGDEAEEKS